MDMYTIGGELRISAKNMPQFKELLEQAQKEARQLNNTIEQLSRFEIVMNFSADGADHTRDMEAASSTISSIPTK